MFLPILPPACNNSEGIPMAPNKTVGSCVCHPLNPGTEFCPERLVVLVVVDDDDPDVVVDKRGTFCTRCITFPSIPIGKIFCYIFNILLLKK